MKPRTDEELEEHFWSQAAPAPGGCLLWQTGKAKDGYGQFYVRGKNVPAHRYAYGITFGELGPGDLLLHKCDTPSCVNPDHLVRGSQKDNMDDMRRKGRQPSVETLRAAAAPQRGEASRWARLTTEDVLTIRRERANGVKPGVLARRFGVRPDYVTEIVKGRAWNHLPVQPKQ